MSPLAAGRPLPVPDPASAPFFAALLQRRLLMQRCTQCGTCQLGETRCNHCDAPAPTWVQACGRGTLHSFTIIHQRYHPAFASRIPYNAAVVELEEGPRLFSTIVDCDNQSLRVGLPLQVDFEQEGDAVLPVFRIRPQPD